MVIAIVKGGVLLPRDPLPADWQDGTEVEVERVISSSGEEDGLHPSDEWMNEVEAIAALGNPADDALLDEAIQAVRRREKDLARKKMELNL